jgi:hypothetical protein
MYEKRVASNAMVYKILFSIELALIFWTNPYISVGSE